MPPKNPSDRPPTPIPARRATPIALVLAAGRSTRMGQPKALLDWFGEPLYAAHGRALNALGPVRTLVVLGADAGTIHASIRARASGSAPLEVIHAPRWRSTSMIDSVRVGLRAIPSAPETPVLVVPIDTPPVEAPVLRALLTADAATVPLDRDGRRGHPIRLPADALARSRHAATTRDLVRGAAGVATASMLVSLGFNTPEAFERVKRVARGGLEPPTPRV